MLYLWNGLSNMPERTCLALQMVKRHSHMQGRVIMSSCLPLHLSCQKNWADYNVRFILSLVHWHFSENGLKVWGKSGVEFWVSSYLFRPLLLLHTVPHHHINNFPPEPLDYSLEAALFSWGEEKQVKFAAERKEATSKTKPRWGAL